MADGKTAGANSGPKAASAKKSAKAKAASTKKRAPKKSAAATAGAKKGGAKRTTAKRGGVGKTTAGARRGPSQAATKKAAAKMRPSRPTVGLDKSIAQLRESLEHSVTLSRDRIQEVVDDAVKRGRMTHGDAEKMLGELLKRGRKQTDALLSELEKLVRQARRKLP